MSTTTRWTVAMIALVASIVVWAAMTGEPLRAGQAGVVPSAQDLRFELLGNEPIAGPDGRALVTDWSVLMFKDRRTERCYVAFKHDGAIAVESAECAPK
jgi:hypothetical protein